MVLAVFLSLYSSLAFAGPAPAQKPVGQTSRQTSHKPTHKLVNDHFVPKFPSCGPESEPSQDIDPKGDLLPSLDFCSRWNPEFIYNGHHCCGKILHGRKAKRGVRCSTQRARTSYCGEITPEEKQYVEKVSAGEGGDLLEWITREIGRSGTQNYCSVNNGFLAHGRPIVPTTLNRIRIRSPERCTNYGTDSMTAMLEWLGRQLNKDYPESEYPGPRLVVGDVAAPRGGCLSGMGGRRGHLSHTTGQDADIAFLVAKAHAEVPPHFHRTFDAKANWRFLKELFHNPYACVKVVFLDKRLIRKLAKAAGRDEEWLKLGRFIRHMPSHKNHFHVRIGEGPGQPGCVADARPELELEETGDEDEAEISLEGDPSGDEGAPDEGDSGAQE